MANAAELEACKEDVAALKKLCRQRTLAVWKAWRADMEADKAKLLQVGRPLYIEMLMDSYTV